MAVDYYYSEHIMQGYQNGLQLDYSSIAVLWNGNEQQQASYMTGPLFGDNNFSTRFMEETRAGRLIGVMVYIGWE